jgi:hypothetical protein
MKRKIRQPDASEAGFARIAKALSEDPRVDALVSSGKGKYFGPGHGRLMKEWLAVDHRNKTLWLRLAREALEFAAARATRLAR